MVEGDDQFVELDAELETSAAAALAQLHAVSLPVDAPGVWIREAIAEHLHLADAEHDCEAILATRHHIERTVAAG